MYDLLPENSQLLIIVLSSFTFCKIQRAEHANWEMTDLGWHTRVRMTYTYFYAVHASFVLLYVVTCWLLFGTEIRTHKIQILKKRGGGCGVGGRPVHWSPCCHQTVKRRTFINKWSGVDYEMIQRVRHSKHLWMNLQYVIVKVSASVWVKRPQCEVLRLCSSFYP